MDKRLRTGGAIALIVAFVASLGVNISNIGQDEGYLPYGCDKESVKDMFCYKLSRVNDDGFQRYCYYDRDRPRSFKVCSTGWYLLNKIPEDMPEEASNFEGCPIKVIAYTDNGKYFCDGIGREADCVRDDEILMPFGGG